MIKNFFPNDDCPIRNLLGEMGDKWTMLVLISLASNGTMRFGELKDSIGDISQRMLTVKLRWLEEQELVCREIHAVMPPRVDYALTDEGKTLVPHLEGLVDWAVKKMNKSCKTEKKELPSQTEITLQGEAQTEATPTNEAKSNAKKGRLIKIFPTKK